jgi:tetratricopeptide (TPR) repeat protein
VSATASKLTRKQLTQAELEVGNAAISLDGQMPSNLPPTPIDLAELGQLHEAVRYLDAYDLSQRFSPLEEWPGTEGLILAGRLASCWGDWARSNRLHTRAWRGAPADPAAIYYQTLTIESHHGPFEALRFIHDQRALLEAAAPTKHHVWLWLQQARLLASFRDFEAAEALLHRAEPHAAGAADPWWWVERARLLEQQDRYTEALASVDQAAKLRPRYRQAIETKAHLLTLVNRDEEAIAALSDSIHYLQAANLAQSLAIYLSEFERHDEALVALDQAVKWLPCADRHQRAWFAARRSDALRHLGRTDEAAAAAREAKTPFFDHVAKRLATPPSGRSRVHLRVGFVRQHHMTCAPATLTALGNFWNHPVDHLELARLICYDGTPDHEERHWAETNGWVVREFRVTWATAVALLDRGCPFTLTTVSPRSAHLQAVVGYDAALELLLIRDPYLRTHGECIGPTFLASCASHGPRGMVLVPADRAHLLDGIEFPDAPLYDGWFALRRALAAHNRVAAQAACERIAALAPANRLTHLAQRELALYDGNLLRQLETTRTLLALYPDDPNFLLDESQFLRALGRSAEHRERVTALVRRPQPDPLFMREGAELLAADGRTHLRAHRLFRRVLRRRSIDAWNLRAFANLLWNQQQFGAATEVYRLAACVGDKTEAHWDNYFAACRHLRAADQCLVLLRQREARLGVQSGQPARTLFRALETLDQTSAGFAMLEAALVRRPDDGDLLLFAVECRARFAQREEAGRLLSAADGRSPRSAWLRTAARVAEIGTDYAAALGHWRELLALSPVDSDAHGAIARLTAIIGGRSAALDFLRDACERHRTLIPLHTLRLEWLRNETPEAALTAVDHLLALDPANAWGLREKSLILGRAHRHEESLGLAEIACRIEPHAHYSHGIRGLALSALGRISEARDAFQASLRLFLDPGYMGELVNKSPDYAARREAVEFLLSECRAQPVPDDGAFLRFQSLARNVLDPDETRAALEALLAAHPNHWATWSALGTHLIEQGQTGLGLTRAREATE